MLGFVKKKFQWSEVHCGGFWELPVGSKRWSSTSRSPLSRSTHTQKMRKFTPIQKMRKIVSKAFNTRAIQPTPGKIWNFVTKISAQTSSVSVLHLCLEIVCKFMLYLEWKSLHPSSRLAGWFKLNNSSPFPSHLGIKTTRPAWRTENKNPNTFGHFERLN